MTAFTITWNSAFEAVPANGDDASEVRYGFDSLRTVYLNVLKLITRWQKMLMMVLIRRLHL